MGAILLMFSTGLGFFGSVLDAVLFSTLVDAGFFCGVWVDYS